jgi:phosphoglycerate dehydrogenase-like enzyme
VNARPLVVVTDPIHVDGYAALEPRYDLLRFDQVRDPGERSAAFERADALVVRNYVLDAATIGTCARLRVVGKHGSGVDNVDVAALTGACVPIANTPGGANATAVAEGAALLMLMVLRRALELDRAVRAGDYAARYRISGGDLIGRTLGIIGIGNIGTHLARICAAGFGMRVLAYDPLLSAGEVAARGATQVATLGELLAAADVVSLHCPLTPQTHGIIDRAALAQMKPTAVLVNCSRGPTVDPRALHDALATRRIRGAGIDVFDPEPPPADDPLFALDNVVLSPHTAGLTEESTRQMALQTVAVIEEMLAGRKPATLLNPEIWERRR